MLRITDINEARERLADIALVTPLNYSRSLSELVGAEVFLKLENLQKTGSFKLRGATNKILSLEPATRRLGVVAASAGNHAQGVALGAKRVGIPATVVMPEGAPLTKVSATRGYGAEIILAGSVYDDAYRKAVEIKAASGATFVHAFDDPQVIAGQGTVGLEILAQLADAEVVVVPIGGGGLAAGIAMAVKETLPGIKVVGVQAQGAPCMAESLKTGRVTRLDQVSTVADGIAVKEPGSLTYEIVSRYVDDVVTVSDEEIAGAILTLLERCKVVAEGAGAVALAALLNHKLNVTGKKVVAVVSGGNIDVNFMAQIIERGLSKSGRKVEISTLLPDRFGNLQKLLGVVTRCRANIISIDHARTDAALPLGFAQVTLTLETENQQQIQRILKELTEAGYPIRALAQERTVFIK